MSPDNNPNRLIQPALFGDIVKKDEFGSNTQEFFVYFDGLFKDPDEWIIAINNGERTVAYALRGQDFLGIQRILLIGRTPKGMVRRPQILLEQEPDRNIQAYTIHLERDWKEITEAHSNTPRLEEKSLQTLSLLIEGDGFPYVNNMIQRNPLSTPARVKIIKKWGLSKANGVYYKSKK